MNRRHTDRSLHRYAIVYGAIIGIAFLLISTCAQGQDRHWTHPVDLHLNQQDSMITEPEMVEMIEYAAWAYSERTGHPVEYVGTTSAEELSGEVVISWATPDKMEELGFSRFASAATLSWYDHGTGEVNRVASYLNTSQSINSSDCLQYAIMHEIGHAMGYEGHSGNRHDVMYTYRPHCRYALTANDVQNLPYEAKTCHVELMANNDLYVPYVEGMAALLKHTGGYTWELDQYVESEGDCSTVERLDGDHLILNDVRGHGVSYYAELEFVGTDSDTWELFYAE